MNERGADFSEGLVRCYPNNQILSVTRSLARKDFVKKNKVETPVAHEQTAAHDLGRVILVQPVSTEIQSEFIPCTCALGTENADNYNHRYKCTHDNWNRQ